MLRGFEVADFDPGEKPNFLVRLWRKLFGGVSPVAKFVQQYEGVRSQVDTVTDDLEGHKTQLLRDIASLDRLYQANLEYFHNLEAYILAGEKKLEYIDSTMIPEAERKAAGSDDVLAAQELRDVRSGRDDLERRVHDLKLTRQVAMQGLPSIRLIQENDKGLVNKINSTLVNTRAAVAPAARPGGDDLPLGRGGQERARRERPDQRAPREERREPPHRQPHRARGARARRLRRQRRAGAPTRT